eukprot:TRINITY_DN12451_c0_g1_i2.p1 TRINITY_DN12451_c0_g1~~TRINITY_DN12451_c0_g1_i2.p1  ORF type:complete len:376 (+),score=89.59 TRINITY_DN12451_c0_g1_i2:255-1382(+)
MYDAWGTKLVFFRQELTNLMYNLDASVIVIGLLIFTNQITKEQRKFPIWKFAIMGFCDGFADFLSSVGGPNTPGSWQTLINQTLVIFIMVFAFIFLKYRYLALQYIAAIVIMIGTLVAILPSFFGSNESSESSGAVNGLTNAVWYSVVIYASNNIPAAGSNVFKEWGFKKATLNVFYLTCLVSWTQLFVSWIFLPLQTINGFGDLSFSELPDEFVNGTKCLIGDTSIPIFNDSGVTGYCSLYVLEITVCYSVSGFIAGIFQLCIVKYGSAVLMAIITAITIPLTNIVFSIEFLMGPDEVEPFSWYSIAGLILVCLGVVIYGIFRKPQDIDIDVVNKANSEDHNNKLIEEEEQDQQVEEHKLTINDNYNIQHEKHI